MKRMDQFRIALIVIVIAVSVWYVYPTLKFYHLSEDQKATMPPEEFADLRAKALRLGLDLQGGMHMVLRIDLSKLPPDEAKDAVARAREIITNRIDQFGVAEPVIQLQGKDRIIVELPGLRDINRAIKLIGETAQLEFQLLREPDELRSALDKIDAVLAQRQVPAGTEKTEKKEKTTGPSSEAADKLFEGADQEQPSEGTEDLFETAEDSLARQHLFRRLIHTYGSDLAVSPKKLPKVKAILQDPEVQAVLPSDSEFLFSRKPEDNGDYILYYVKKQPEMTGAVVSDAWTDIGSGFDPKTAGKPVIHFDTTDDGARIFSRVTGANVGRRLSIVLDGKVYSAPVIQTKIRDGQSIITGMQSMEEATDIAIVLRAGALPAPVEVLNKQVVGPSLGADSIRMGVQAALVGLILVVIFILVYYRLSGLVAVVALGLNMVLLMAALAGLHATLTLPGIAGIILTIGMAVDANVLIFERIREELRGGKSVRVSIANGYSRAFRTILDANVTTLITAAVLYQFGTGPIRGFAVTLSIGIVASMFTAIVVTRAIFDFVTRRWDIQRLSIGTSPIRDTKIPFIDVRRIAFLGSIAAITIGLMSLGVHKGPNLGIDFEGGTLLELHFDPPVAIEDLREALSEVDVAGQKVDLGRSEIKEYGNPNDILVRIERVGKVNEELVSSAVKTKLRETFSNSIPEDEDQWLRREVNVGPKIGSELRGQAMLAILYSMIGILIYVTWRFEFRFAVAAIVALFHDVLFTVGVFSLFNMEISLAVVAALLTIVGYSLNDTIVVCDRIREDLRLYRREQYSRIINRSINETLSRTLITSLTTLIVVLCLLFLGGEVITDFAFALTIGVLVGTYSSIFVASPILVEWRERSERRQKERKLAGARR